MSQLKNSIGHVADTSIHQSGCKRSNRFLVMNVAVRGCIEDSESIKRDNCEVQVMLLQYSLKRII